MVDVDVAMPILEQYLKAYWGSCLVASMEANRIPLRQLGWGGTLAAF